MPLSKSRPSPRPSAISSFSDISNKSDAKKDKSWLQLAEDGKETTTRRRQHERQRSQAQPQASTTAARSPTTTTRIIPAESPTDVTRFQSGNYENDVIAESSVIGASPSPSPSPTSSTAGRFTRPDYLLQDLLTRAKKRVRDRKARGDEDVSHDFDKFFLIRHTLFLIMTTICMSLPGEARIGEKEYQATAASAQISQPLSRARMIFFFSCSGHAIAINSPELAPQWRVMSPRDGCHDGPMSTQLTRGLSFLPFHPSFSSFNTAFQLAIPLNCFVSLLFSSQFISD
jgi:hypothetical protein